ncbi:hypothetical protein PYCC9005_004195 [Savitreella phatthalungensis]
MLAGICIGTLVALLTIFRPTLILAFAAGAGAVFYLYPHRQLRRQRQAHRLQVSQADEDVSFDESIVLQLPPACAIQVERFVDQVMRDYVLWWYKEPTFTTDSRVVDACKAALGDAISTLYSNLRNRDTTRTLKCIWTSMTSTMGFVLADLRSMHAGHNPTSLEAFISAQPQSAIAQLADESNTNARIRLLSARVLRKLARPEDLACEAARLFLQQILATSVLLPLVRASSTSTAVNQLILILFSPSSPEMSSSDRKDAKGEQDVHQSFTAPGQALEYALSPSSLMRPPPAESWSLADVPEVTDPPPTPIMSRRRGRRLSFGKRELSPDSQTATPEKRPHFLRRAFSKSRSRSSSPQKSLRMARITVEDFTEYEGGITQDSRVADSIPAIYGVMVVHSSDGAGYTVMRNQADVTLLRDLTCQACGSTEDTDTYSDARQRLQAMLQRLASADTYTAQMATFCEPSLAIGEFAQAHHEGFKAPPFILENLVHERRQRRASSSTHSHSPEFRRTIGSTRELVEMLSSTESRPASPQPRMVATVISRPPEVTLDDVQDLVDESMELMLSFFALSPRTWSIRGTILSILRSQYLSRNSRYSRDLKASLEMFLAMLVEDSSMAHYLSKINDRIVATHPAEAGSPDSELRKKAETAFMNHALPSSVRSLMGTSATEESLQIVFDALQEERLMQGLLAALLEKMVIACM